MKQKTSAKDESIWKDAETLSPEDTKDTKVHLSLRLDPNVYRRILAIKKVAGDRTITSTIERLLEQGMHEADAAEVTASDLTVALRNLLTHTVVQDNLLAFLATRFEPTSTKEKDVLRTFMSHRHAYDSIVKSILDEKTTEISFLHHLTQIILPIKERPLKAHSVDDRKRVKTH